MHSVALLIVLAASRVPSVAGIPCGDPGADPWIAETAQRALDFDDLLGFAVARFGAPVRCEGSVTQEFDGVKFGGVVLRFAEGATFEIETMPPETSVVTLRDPGGFDAPEDVMDALRAYTAGRGLSIAWADPERVADGDELTERFWDPTEGLNASASLMRSGGALVAVRVAMAL